MIFIKKITIAALFALIFTAAFGITAAAEHYAIDGTEIPIDIVVNGYIIKVPEKAFLDTEKNTTYVPLRPVAEVLGAAVTWNEQDKTAVVQKNETILEFSENNSESEAVLYNSMLFVPARILPESFGYTAEWDDYYYQVHIEAPDITVSEECVDYTYTNDDILIVAQVLTCECGSASFDGKIAVANVICNRVASSLFPDTVKEVIYDNRGGSVQFSIAYNGKLDNTPSVECMLAAKCALDGKIVAADCLFFQADYVQNSWTNKNREYVMTVDGNAFFG